MNQSKLKMLLEKLRVEQQQVIMILIYKYIYIYKIKIGIVDVVFCCDTTRSMLSFLE